MPGGFSLGLNVCGGEAVGVSTGTSKGTTLTGSATPHTKGTYAQLIAATTYDTNAIFMSFAEGSYDANAGNVSVDLAVGASSFEKIVVPDYVLRNSAGISSIASGVTFPLNIPAGTRIAARAQSKTASQTCFVGLVLFQGSLDETEGLSGYDAIGFVSASTQGSSIVPNASANTKGVYTEMVASSAKDYAGLFGNFDSLNATANSPRSWLVDIAVGANGSEQIMIPNMFINRSNQYVIDPMMPFIPVNIPAGSRIAVRAQSSTAGSDAFGFTLYGGYR
jgi:uncharacterized protein YbdZ (MbtH family)